MDKIKKILIANRGEIARRIQATCLALNIETVAIYAPEDRFAPYVYFATEAYELKKNGFAGYLDQQIIIEIAKQSNADAIHPGYGFLSENGTFAQLVDNSGLRWIGPTPQNILMLGNKAEAQRIMKQSGIPTIPGRSFKTSAAQEAKRFAEEIGYPILIKCAHGGGGKGMRSVEHSEQFDDQWMLVASESGKQFNSQTIIVEKKIEHPRHVEVQIAGDGTNYIHIYERECSIQRRHQKIIEETPCNFISNETKQKLYQAATEAARSVNYKNIGTVEFLVDQSGAFYFLEINTRLQVEHSVTELTTGIDLVELQIILAQNMPLPYTQEQISHHGHAIECRIYAEDPQHNFAPSAGKITNFVLPNFPYLRIDNDIEEGMEISPSFDPMLLKFTTYGITRERAIQNMIASLSATHIFGIETNILFLQQILKSQESTTGNIHTQLLQNKKYLITLVNHEKTHLEPTKQHLQELAEKIKTHFGKKEEVQTDIVSQWKKRQW